MKKILLVSAALLSAHVAFPQGQITFDNRANAAGTPGSFPGVVIAPIYNMDPSCNTCVKQGNTSAGSPTGSATYNGSLLFNDATHNYTATLWAINTANFSGSRTDDKNDLELIGTTPMRTSTSGTSAGRVAGLAVNPVVPNTPLASDRATFQVRVWDSRGGTIQTWAQVLADNTIPRGYSTVFDLPYTLGGYGQPPSTAPNLEGWQSFQLFLAVPEPSVIALGVLGAGCLFLLRRRK